MKGYENVYTTNDGGAWMDKLNLDFSGFAKRMRERGFVTDDDTEEV